MRAIVLTLMVMAAPLPKLVIEPGKRLGAVTIGMTKQELLKLPGKVYDGGGTVSVGIYQTMLDDGGKVVWITVNASDAGAFIYADKTYAPSSVEELTRELHCTSQFGNIGGSTTTCEGGTLSFHHAGPASSLSVSVSKPTK